MGGSEALFLVKYMFVRSHLQIMKDHSRYDEIMVKKKTEEVLIDVFGQTLMEIIPLGMLAIIRKTCSPSSCNYEQQVTCTSEKAKL